MMSSRYRVLRWKVDSGRGLTNLTSPTSLTNLTGSNELIHFAGVGPHGFHQRVHVKTLCILHHRVDCSSNRVDTHDELSDRSINMPNSAWSVPRLSNNRRRRVHTVRNRPGLEGTAAANGKSEHDVPTTSELPASMPKLLNCYGSGQWHSINTSLSGIRATLNVLRTSYWLSPNR